jgi:hypothetical protein
MPRMVAWAGGDNPKVVKKASQRRWQRAETFKASQPDSTTQKHCSARLSEPNIRGLVGTHTYSSSDYENSSGGEKCWAQVETGQRNINLVTDVGNEVQYGHESAALVAKILNPRVALRQKNTVTVISRSKWTQGARTTPSTSASADNTKHDWVQS